MLQKFDVTGVHFTVDNALRAYVDQKLGTIDHYIPRRERQAAHLQIRLYEQKINSQTRPVCEAVLRLPGETFTLTEPGATMYAAIDIVKAKLKQELSHYKGEYPDGNQRRHLFGRLKGKLASLIPGRQ